MVYQVIKHYHENSQKMFNYRLTSRVLWDDHISFTRNAIVSILGNLPDVNVIGQRLMKNQEDIGSFIGAYYSNEQISTYVDLLKQHISIAVDVISGVEEAEARWRSNGEDIVQHMSNMNNIYWTTAIISPLWTKHMDLTIEQVNSRNAVQWEADIAAYDKNHMCMNEFSDIFSNGVIYQNMDDFCVNITGEYYGFASS